MIHKFSFHKFHQLCRFHLKVICFPRKLNQSPETIVFPEQLKDIQEIKLGTTRTDNTPVATAVAMTHFVVARGGPPMATTKWVITGKTTGIRSKNTGNTTGVGLKLLKNNHWYKIRKKISEISGKATGISKTIDKITGEYLESLEKHTRNTRDMNAKLLSRLKLIRRSNLKQNIAISRSYDHKHYLYTRLRILLTSA